MQNTTKQARNRHQNPRAKPPQNTQKPLQNTQKTISAHMRSNKTAHSGSTGTSKPGMYFFPEALAAAT